MFIQLGDNPDVLDKSRTVSISSTTELRDDCILGVVRIDLFIMLQLKHKEPKFAKTFVNLMVGKRQLDIKNKVILGVDLLHRANISINSNGHQFALIARMTKENGLKSRVRLQQHIWAKDIEMSCES